MIGSHVTQNLRQLVDAELARSATTVRIRGQPDLVAHVRHLPSMTYQSEDLTTRAWVHLGRELQGRIQGLDHAAD